MGITRAIDKLFIEIEDTPGTFKMPGPSGFIEVVEASVPEIVSEPIEKRANPNTLIKTEKAYAVKKHVEFSVKVYFRKGADGTTPPRIGMLLRAAGLKQVIGTDHVKYIPTTEVTPTLSILAQYDTDANPYQVKIKGAVVENLKISGKLGDFVIMECTIKGVLEDESNSADSIDVADDTTDLIIANSLSSSTGMTHFDSFEITIANTVYESPDPSSETCVDRYYIVAQEVTGNLKGEFDNSFLPDCGDELANFYISKNNVFQIKGDRVQLIEEDDITIEDEVFTHAISFKFMETGEENGEAICIKFF